MRIKQKLMAIVLALAMVHEVSADSTDLDDLIDYIVNAITESLIAGINGIVDAIIQTIHNSLYNLLVGLMELVIELLIYNPPLEPVYDLWNEVRLIVTSLYVIVLIIAGYRLLAGVVMDSNPSITFREWVIKTIASIILVTVSFELFQLILDFEKALSASLFVNPELSGFLVASASVLLILFINVSLVLGVILMFILRHILVMVGAVFFPIVLFLYLLPPTRRIGQTFLTMLAVIIFLPFVEILLLRLAMVAFSSMGSSFEGTLFNAVFGLGMMLMMLLTPAIMLQTCFNTGGVISGAMESTRQVTRIISGAPGISAPKYRQTTLKQYAG